MQALRTRVGEMREPPLGLEAVPDPACRSSSTKSWPRRPRPNCSLGLYERALPALDAALARHLADTNPLADAPAVRVCRFARLELADMIEFGAQCIAASGGCAGREPHATLARNCSSRLSRRGRRTGRHRAAYRRGPSATAPFGQRLTSTIRVPKRDERFQDLYNQGVNAEAFLYDPEFPAAAQDADDALQAAARDRRAGDDGQHHSRDQGQAVGLLPRHVAASSGTRPATP